MVEVNLSPYEHGDTKTVMLVVRDITEKREIQSLVMQTEKMTLLGEMISGVAHELNNPLTGIMGYSELLCEENLSADIYKKLENINKEAIQCRRIVQNLLTFARKRTPERELVNINESMKETIEFKSYDLRTSGVEIETIYEARSLITKADAYQIKQVFLNIINNAQHALVEKEDTTAKRIKVITKSKDGNIVINIEDNGCGISKANLKKIFSPFFTTKEPGKGTGLGLSVCYGIVKEHGGNITVKSTMGKGTVFTISFPESAENSLVNEKKDVTPANKENESKGRILIIDDDEIVASVMTEILAREGHEVERAENGKKGFEIIMKQDFNAIICDIKMPVMDGKKVFSLAAEEKPEITNKFLIVTGDTFNTETANFLEDSKVATIEKPFEKTHLVKEVNKILKNSNSPSPGIRAA